MRIEVIGTLHDNNGALEFERESFVLRRLMPEIVFLENANGEVGFGDIDTSVNNLFMQEVAEVFPESRFYSVDGAFAESEKHGPKFEKDYITSNGVLTDAVNGLLAGVDARHSVVYKNPFLKALEDYEHINRGREARITDQVGGLILGHNIENSVLIVGAAHATRLADNLGRYIGRSGDITRHFAVPNWYRGIAHLEARVVHEKVGTMSYTAYLAVTALKKCALEARKNGSIPGGLEVLGSKTEGFAKTLYIEMLNRAQDNPLTVEGFLDLAVDLAKR